MPAADGSAAGLVSCWLGSSALWIPDMNASAVFILDSSPHDSDPESPVSRVPVLGTSSTLLLLLLAPPEFGVLAFSLRWVAIQKKIFWLEFWLEHFLNVWNLKPKLK